MTTVPPALIFVAPVHLQGRMHDDSGFRTVVRQLECVISLVVGTAVPRCMEEFAFILNHWNRPTVHIAPEAIYLVAAVLVPIDGAYLKRMTTVT